MRNHRIYLGLIIVLLTVWGAACSPAATPSAQQQPAQQAPAQQAPAQKPAEQKPVEQKAAAPAAQPTQAAAQQPAAGAAGQPVKGGTLTVSHGQNVADTLNQHISINTTSRMVAAHVLDRLVAVDPKTGDIKPWLAESWEISPDGKVYTFKLRKDVKFHDGTPFNAQAVKYNFDYTMRPDIKHGFSYAAMGGEKYDKTEVVDDATVKVTFKGPNPSFLNNLSDGGLGIDSPTAMEKAGADYGVKVLVGSGPFKFKEWVKDQQVVLTRNDDYKWPPAVAKNKGAAYLDQLVYRDVADNATRAAALEAGELQLATLIESQVKQFQGNKDAQILMTPKAGTVRMYLFNTAVPPMNDLKVRQAINHAIDKAALLKLPAWSNIGNPGVAPLPANMFPGGKLDQLKQYDYPFDVAKANALLDEAGWKMGADGLREKDGKKLVIDFIVPSTSLNQVEPLDEMLKKIGGKLSIRQGDFNWHIAERAKREYMWTLSSDSGYDSLRLLTYFFHSASPSNNYGYKGVDAILDKAANSTNAKDVWDRLNEAQAQIMKDAVGVMGWEQMYVYGAGAKVNDVFFNEVGFPYFYDTWMAK